MTEQTDLQYPVGKFERPSAVTYAVRKGFIQEIESAPQKLRAAVKGLDEKQLDTPYREGGWTIRQVVHHLPDSHINAYVRFKFALTEDEPTIKVYDEARWAELPEARIGPIELSLSLLEAVHRRWVAAIETLPDEFFDRAFMHPEMGRLSLNEQLALYAWHGRHHIAHITGLRERQGWK
ncbi:MAG: putative metal-dependent hydrolase [Acidobacteria bacterium]|nr:putative metal-dependent hydrolase [Acidobacteriota bacterium]